MNFLSKIASIIFLFLLNVGCQSLWAQQVTIEVDGIKQLNYVKTKMGNYRPAFDEELYEVQLNVTNRANNKSELLVDRLRLEGNGYTSEVELIFTGKKSPVRPESTLKLSAGKTHAIKVYYDFPREFTPANLVYDGNLILPVQDGIENIILLNSFNRPTASEDEAKFRREIVKLEEGWMIKDFYFESGNLQMEMPCSEIYPMVEEGKSVWYYENGNIENERVYVDGEVTGMSYSYYEDGSAREVTCRVDGVYKYHHYYDEYGVDQLKNGMGQYSRSEKGHVYWSIVEDSVLIGSFNIMEDTGDTLFSVVEQMPKPIGGMRGFYQCIQKTLKYPAPARRKGVQGKVFVQFIVDKNGDLIDVKSVKGIGSGCDEESVRAIKECDPWEPAKFKGKNVKVRMILPITFKLG